MGFFKNLFFPLKSRFKKMDTLTQNRVALSVSLAGYAQRAAEEKLLPEILPALGVSLPVDLKKKVSTELAIGVVACVRMPDKLVLNDVWGLEGESLRQMVAMLVFSENSDSRQVLENARYSSNPDEARVQVLLSIVRLVGSKDDTLITRLNTQEFGREWNGFATEFVDGAITGFKRVQRSAMIDSIANKLESLTQRGKALIEELAKRCAEAPAKAQPNPSSLLDSNSRAQILSECSPMRGKAIDLMKSGNYQAALESFKLLLDEDARDWTLLYMAGQCARFTNDIPLAVSYLKCAALLHQAEPQLFLALGIAHQLCGQLRESEDALRKALELDADMESAYNSLGITQKKMGELDLALHNLEEGLKALSRHIARTMKNQRESKIFPHPNVLGTRWTQVAMNGAMYLCAKDADISRLAWPTGEQAIQEASTKAHAGLFWKDSVDASGTKTRLFLPNFFNTFCALLRQEQVYGNTLGNLGSVLDLMGKPSEAKVCFSEAEEFLN